jgi:selenocysteine-specific elongation factor
MALRLSDTSVEEVGRGMVLAEPGYFTPTRLVNARFHSLPSLGRPLKPRTAIRFHVGTTDVTGHLILPDLTPLLPGAETYVQFQLTDLVVAAPGDFFVARQLTPLQTIGGGNVISMESVKMRRRKGQWLEQIKEREEAFTDPAATLGYALKQAGPAPLPLADLARLGVLSEEATRRHLADLLRTEIAVELPGNRYVHGDTLAAATTEILERLNRMHDTAPLSLGFPKKDLIRELTSVHLVIDKALDRLVEAGTLARNGTGYQIPARAPKLSPGQSAIAARLNALYVKTAFASPRRDELPELLGVPAPVLAPIVSFLLQSGDLVVIDERVILHKTHLEESKRRLTDFLTRNRTMDSGMFKDLIGATRKYAIPLLEYWDAKGLTRREGNNRLLRETR